MQFVPFILGGVAIVLGLLFLLARMKSKIYQNLHKPLLLNLTKLGSLTNYFEGVHGPFRSMLFDDFKVVYVQLLHEHLWDLRMTKEGYGKFYFEELMGLTVWRYKTDKHLTRQECRQLYYVYLREYREIDVQKIKLFIEESNREDTSINLCENYEAIRKAMSFVLTTEEIKGDFAALNLKLAFSLETKIKNAIKNDCLMKTDFSNDCLLKISQDEYINPELRSELKKILEQKTKK